MVWTSAGQLPETEVRQSSVSQDGRHLFVTFNEPVGSKLNTLWGHSLTLNR